MLGCRGAQHHDLRRGVPRRHDTLGVGSRAPGPPRGRSAVRARWGLSRCVAVGRLVAGRRFHSREAAGMTDDPGFRPEVWGPWRRLDDRIETAVKRATDQRLKGWERAQAVRELADIARDMAADNALLRYSNANEAGA